MNMFSRWKHVWWFSTHLAAASFVSFVSSFLWYPLLSKETFSLTAAYSNLLRFASLWNWAPTLAARLDLSHDASRTFNRKRSLKNNSNSIFYRKTWNYLGLNVSGEKNHMTFLAAASEFQDELHSLRKATRASTLTIWSKRSKKQSFAKASKTSVAFSTFTGHPKSRVYIDMRWCAFDFSEPPSVREACWGRSVVSHVELSRIHFFLNSSPLKYGKSSKHGKNGKWAQMRNSCGYVPKRPNGLFFRKMSSFWLGMLCENCTFWSCWPWGSAKISSSVGSKSTWQRRYANDQSFQKRLFIFFQFRENPYLQSSQLRKANLKLPKCHFFWQEVLALVHETQMTRVIEKSCKVLFQLFYHLCYTYFIDVWYVQNIGLVQCLSSTSTCTRHQISSTTNHLLQLWGMFECAHQGTNLISEYNLQDLLQILS